MAWAPDECVVITLRNRTDRLDEFRRHAGNLGFPYTVVTVDAPTDKPAGYLGSAASWGNAMSHKSVLGLGKSETILVFEDDAVIPPDFQDRMAQLLSSAPSNWELLLLGGSLMGLPVPLDGDAQRLTHFNRTHAYVVRGEARSVASWAAGAAVEHWDDKLGRVMGQRYSAYSPKDLFVDVSGMKSDIPDSAPLTGRIGSGSGNVHIPLRIGQRYDGLGAAGHARLSPASYGPYGDTGNFARLVNVGNDIDQDRQSWRSPYTP
jgi:hypothetical protein